MWGRFSHKFVRYLIVHFSLFQCSFNLYSVVVNASLVFFPCAIISMCFFLEGERLYSTAPEHHWLTLNCEHHSVAHLLKVLQNEQRVNIFIFVWHVFINCISILIWQSGPWKPCWWDYSIAKQIPFGFGFISWYASNSTAPPY